MGLTPRSRTKVRQGTCAYCGATGEVTRDHVIPRALFITMDVQMITVPACAACQREKGYGDDDLRDFVNLDWAGSQHPNALKQLERIARATLVERSKFGRAFTKGGVDQELVTGAGIYFGEVHAVPIDSRDMFNTLEYIVRGLYFHEMKQRLPPESPVVIKHVPPLQARELLTKLRELPHRGPTVKGNTVAWWASFHPEGEPETTLWLLVFNDRVYFLGSTGTLAERELQRQAESAVGES
jgi:hypothetical protein